MSSSTKLSHTTRKQRLTEILARPYARILIPDDDGTYTAEILEFPGCYGEGDTAADAVNDLEQAATSWIEAAIEQGQEIPAPLDTCEYSGKINLRLPKSLHKQAARFAKREDISLNQFFATAIAARVGAEELCERLPYLFQVFRESTVTNINVQLACNDETIMAQWLRMPKGYEHMCALLPTAPATEPTKVLSDA